MERNQRTSDEGKTTKSENERAIDPEKTIDVDEASQDSTQNSQQENGTRRDNGETPNGRWNL